MASRNRARRLDPRRAKIHHSYTVAEAAALLGVHRNTVRLWIADGLGVIGRGRGLLILGSELRDYLCRKQRSRRTPCGPGAMFCMKCRAPRRPPPELVEVSFLSATGANLRGICPECGTMMHRRAKRSGLMAAGFDGLMATEGSAHLADSASPSVDCAEGKTR